MGARTRALASRLFPLPQTGGRGNGGRHLSALDRSPMGGEDARLSPAPFSSSPDRGRGGLRSKTEWGCFASPNKPYPDDLRSRRAKPNQSASAPPTPTPSAARPPLPPMGGEETPAATSPPLVVLQWEVRTRALALRLFPLPRTGGEVACEARRSGGASPRRINPTPMTFGADEQSQTNRQAPHYPSARNAAFSGSNGLSPITVARCDLPRMTMSSSVPSAPCAGSTMASARLLPTRQP